MSNHINYTNGFLFIYEDNTLSEKLKLIAEKHTFKYKLAILDSKTFDIYLIPAINLSFNTFETSISCLITKLKFNIRLLKLRDIQALFRLLNMLTQN